jgi:hypothetical protein
MARKKRKRKTIYIGPSHAELSPWDKGVLDGHLMAPLRTHEVQERLNRAARQRNSLLSRLLPGRRRYLDGLIWSLESEIKRRGH